MGARPADHEPAPPSDPAQPGRAPTSPGPKGRAWLLAQILPDDESAAIERHLREYDRLTEDLRVLERELARDALGSTETKRLMTIPGIDMVVAVGLLAAIGPINR